MIVQPDIFINLIGTCRSCEIETCATPKIKKLHPENGCMFWETPETVAFRKVIDKNVEGAND